METNYYFTINEAEEEQMHIGTIIVPKCNNSETTNKIFKEKLKTACEQHFDNDVIIPDNIHFVNALKGDTENITIMLPNSPIFPEIQITVQETWIY